MFASDVFDDSDRLEDPALDWDEALCADETGTMTALFFSDQIPDIRRAKALCLGCALAAPCLAGAVARREPWGVWGGELFANGKILAQKRKRGRPPKNRPVEGIQLVSYDVVLPGA